MLRKLFSLAAFAVLGSVALAADDDKKPTPKLDKGKLFEKMDANADGKVTKEEYKKFREEAVEKLKDKAPGKLGGQLDTVFDKLFEKLDADGDGTITKEEFEKFEPAGGKLDADKLKALLEKLKEKKGKQ